MYALQAILHGKGLIPSIPALLMTCTDVYIHMISKEGALFFMMFSNVIRELSMKNTINYYSK